MNYLVVDTETNEGSIKGKLTNLWCIGFYDPDKRAKFSLSEEDLKHESNRKATQELLDNNKVVFHHAAFDIWVLESFGFKVNKFHDTMMMSYCLFPGEEHGLRALGERYQCDVTKTDFHDFSKYSEEMAEYCRNDCESTWHLFDKMVPLIKADKKVWNIYLIELSFVRSLIDLRNNGVFIDKENWEVTIKEVENKQRELYKQIVDLIPFVPVKSIKTKNPRPAHTVCDEDNLEDGKFLFDNEKDGVWTYKKVGKLNPGSSDQISYALTKLYGWKPTKFSDKTGKPSVNAEVIESLDYPLSNLLEDYAELSKLTSTFGDSMLSEVSSDGRIRPSFNPTVTLTGRLSCSGVNVQTIPKKGEYGEKLRNFFVASPSKVLVGADVDAFQMRILSWYLHNFVDTHDASALFNEFNNAEHPDPHQAKADLLGITRMEGKTLNFSVLFGAGLNKVAKQLKISVRDAKILLQKDTKKNPSIGILKNMIVNACKSRGGFIYSLYGRRGFYPDILSNDKSKQSHAERQAFNFVIQATEADIIKQWAVKVKEAIDEHWLDAKLILQIHDELLWEVSHEDADKLIGIVQSCLQDTGWLPGLKLTTQPKQGKSWGEVH